MEEVVGELLFGPLVAVLAVLPGVILLSSFPRHHLLLVVPELVARHPRRFVHRSNLVGAVLLF
jgi:hypothetical protein